jgi:UDP-3-O-[3-hydroxymyristoyl] glucosamine N-acyltransferase
MDFPSPIDVLNLSEIIGAEVSGDKSVIVSGLNEIHRVRKGDVTFVDHPKYYEKVLNSKASAIIINKKRRPPKGKVLLYHPDPFNAFLVLIKRFRPFEKSVKPVSDKAEIGEGTVIQPGVFIGNNVKIGKNCIIHSNVSINDYCLIGDNVIINSNSVIGGDAYYFQKREGGYKKFLSCGRVIVEDNVEIGALCSIDRGVTSDTIIGAGTKFDNHCQVGHDTVIGKNCLIGAFTAIAGVTTVEDEVVTWANVLINKDVVVGKRAVLLATTGVDKSLEGGRVYMGAPAMDVRQYWREHIAKSKMPDVVKHLKL